MDNLCKNCIFWKQIKKARNFDDIMNDTYSNINAKPAKGECSSDKFIDTSESGDSCLDIDGLAYSDQEACGASFITGPDFGCIHFQTKGL
jgi:hypothetical protein